MRRRDFLGFAGASVLAGCATTGSAVKPRVLVIGAGFGGATCAKYTAMWDPSLDVVLVDRATRFVSCPLSNLVLGGSRSMRELVHGYEALQRYGVHVLEGEAVAVDPVKRRVTFGRGSQLVYDRLVLSPGVDFMVGEIDGYETAHDRVVHAWKAGEQTQALRRQLEAMPDGGVCVLSIPSAPYRCPPGPYERACQIAHYFKQAKPRSKVLVLDANPDLTSKGPLFKRAWSELYDGMIEYQPNARVVAVDAAQMSVHTEFDTVKGDVLNVVPPQRAGDIAVRAGVTTEKSRWCAVDWRTMESRAAPGIHVLGDATLSAPGMPKSGHMANAQAKICAAALVDLLNGREPNQSPLMNNACYSFVSDTKAMHVASVHRYDAAQRTMLAVIGAGGLSSAPSELEGRYAWGWARNIWADTLG